MPWKYSDSASGRPRRGLTAGGASVYAATKLHQEHLCEAFPQETDSRPLGVALSQRLRPPDAAGHAVRWRGQHLPQRVRTGTNAVACTRTARSGGISSTSPTWRWPTRPRCSRRCRSTAPSTWLPRRYARWPNVAQTLGDAYGPDRPGTAVVTGAYRLADVRHVTASPGRARRWLGFRGSIPFERGMAEVRDRRASGDIPRAGEPITPESRIRDGPKGPATCPGNPLGWSGGSGTRDFSTGPVVTRSRVAAASSSMRRKEPRPRVGDLSTKNVSRSIPRARPVPIWRTCPVVVIARHTEGARQNQARRRDGVRASPSWRQHKDLGAEALSASLLLDSAHDEDVVILTQGHDEDEHEEWQRESHPELSADRDEDEHGRPTAV